MCKNYDVNLFVYGTLRDPAVINRLAALSLQVEEGFDPADAYKFMGKAEVSGVMYSAKHCPFPAADFKAKGTVRGEVVKVSIELYLVIKHYEGELYKPVSVVAKMVEGGEEVHCASFEGKTVILNYLKRK